MQQVVLFGEAEVDDLQAFLPVFLDQLDMPADVGFVAAVLADDDLDLVPHAGRVAAVIEQHADLIDAFQAGAQVGRAIRHRDAEDEVVAVIVDLTLLAALGNQRFLFAEQRLVARQQRMKIRLAGPHGLFQQGVAGFVEIDQRIEGDRTRQLRGHVGQPGNSGLITRDAIPQVGAGRFLRDVGAGHTFGVGGGRKPAGGLACRDGHRNGGCAHSAKQRPNSTRP